VLILTELKKIRNQGHVVKKIDRFWTVFFYNKKSGGAILGAG